MSLGLVLFLYGAKSKRLLSQTRARLSLTSEPVVLPRRLADSLCLTMKASDGARRALRVPAY